MSINDKNETATAVEMPPSLQPGGPIAQTIERRCQSYHAVEGVDKLADRVRADMKHLRVVYAQAIKGLLPRVQPDAEHALDAALVSEHHASDAVLRYSVAVAESSQHWATQLFPKARTAYLSNPVAYDAVMHEAIPATFMNHCNRHLAEQAYFNGTNPTALGDWKFYLEWDENRPAGRTGLPTGLEPLDRITGGTEGLTFVAGASGLGKTSLAMTMALSALADSPDLGVVYFTFDMPKSKLKHRLICRTARLDNHVVKSKNFTTDQARAITDAKEKLERSVIPRIRFVEWGFAQEFDISGGTYKRRLMKLDFLVESINHFAREARVAGVMVVVDSLSKMVVAKPGTPELAADQRRLDLLRQLRDWSRSPANRNPHSIDGYPLVAVAEVTKSGAQSDELDLEDMLGSTKFGYAADTVIGVQADRGRAKAPGELPVLLRTLKARSGEAGESAPATYHFHQFRFTEPAAAKPKGDAPAKKRYASSH